MPYWTQLFALISAIITGCSGYGDGNYGQLVEHECLGEQVQSVEALISTRKSQPWIASVALPTSLSSPCSLEHRRAASIFQWVFGPYAVHTFMISTDIQESHCHSGETDQATCRLLKIALLNSSISNSILYFDNPFDLYHFEVLSLELAASTRLRRWLHDRYGTITVRFCQSKPVTSLPIELRWIHFRGNLGLVPLGSQRRRVYDNGRCGCLLHQPVIQSSQPGHLFAVLHSDRLRDRKAIYDARLSSQCIARADIHRNRSNSFLPFYCNDNDDNDHKFDDNMQFYRISRLLLVPAIRRSDCAVVEFIIDMQFGDSALISSYFDRQSGLKTCVIAFDSEKHLLTGTTNAKAVPPAPADNRIDAAVELTQTRSRLLTYLTDQRACQIALNVWAAPAIPTTNKPMLLATERSLSSSLVETKDILYKIFTLPTELTKDLQDFQLSSKLPQQGAPKSQPEPPISLVFNQDVSRTNYTPLSPPLLRRLEQAVLQAARDWLPVPHRDQLVVTGAYGIREYQRNAVVRWHVDPVETQPLTAVVHIQSSNSGHSDDWAFTVPRYARLVKDNASSIGERYDVIWPASALLAAVKGEEYSLSNDNLNHDHAILDDLLTDIYLKPGEFVLLQSGKLPHARSVPYKGDWYANAFVHLAPRGWDERADIEVLV